MGGLCWRRVGERRVAVQNRMLMVSIIIKERLERTEAGNMFPGKNVPGRGKG